MSSTLKTYKDTHHLTGLYSIGFDKFFFIRNPIWRITAAILDFMTLILCHFQVDTRSRSFLGLQDATKIHQYRKKLWRKCVASNGAYFEGNKINIEPSKLEYFID